MIRLPPLQSARFDFGGSLSCDPATGSGEFGGSRTCDSATGPGEFGVAAALTSRALSRSAGSGAGLKVESSLFHNGRSEDFHDALAVSGHCTTANLSITTHRPT